MSKFHLLFLALLLQLTACLSHKELLYVQDLPPNGLLSDSIRNQLDLKIQPEDLLHITVSSYNTEASKPFNLEAADAMAIAQSAQSSTNVAEMLAGYFVDKEGFIDFPVLGRLPVAGTSLEETKAALATKLKAYLKDAVINIRYLNLKVGVLGEVARPGNIRLSNKRITIFEALASAGDVTSFANRKNILVVREQNGKREFARLNLQSVEVFKSPYFYLQQNDMVYVEPLPVKRRTIDDSALRTTSFVSAGISVIGVILAIALRN